MVTCLGELMRYQEYKRLILSDLHRVTGTATFSVLCRQVLAGDAYQYVFWMRTCRYTASRPVLKHLIYPIALLMLRHCKYKFGIDIPYTTPIGSGFYIGHFSGIFINEECVIGKNCNVSQGVTIGNMNRGARAGCPVIGDNVYIGPGAKIIGAVRIGDCAAIGANCVVTRDVPPHGVVVGVPGKVISNEGSTGYINRVDYDDPVSGRSTSTDAPEE